MWRCCENFSPLKYALSSTLLPCCRFSSHFKAPFSSHCHGKGGGAAAGARNEKLRVFIVAGEPSGDLIGSRLMASLRRLSPRPLQFAGVGGNLMKREGLVSEFPMEDIAVMGVAELLPHLVRIWVRLRQTVTAVMDFRPHVVVTVDAKGFSFRVLRSITDAYRRLGVSRPPLVHYVAPSSWAWKGGENKLKNLADTLDHLLCILPFEAALFKAHGIKATYVGHPVLEDAFTSVATGENPAHCRWWIKGSKSCSRQDFGLQSGSTVVCVLPGSRAQEVKRMLPLFESALDLLADKVPMLTAIIPTAPSHVITDAVTEAVKSWKTPNILLPYASEKDKYSAFAASDVSLCTSGTAVLQLQMARVPTVVAYRAHPLTEWLIKSRTKLHYISLPNILLDSPVIPEALFADCTPQRLFTLLCQVLEDSEVKEQQAKAAEQVLSMLVPPQQSVLESTGSLCSVENVFDWRPSMAAASTILTLLQIDKT
ncbi:hypothetical protein CY35_07G011200 [Sphagnum magellanicum]|uniref:Uncharacterized protein n=2 Tax=Sphagnum magellanicum TaxID=128215 RepID=A0ACB8HIW0_9BRYO|nr:hypothetical protein CY35_07G011200 [Sphagnum magellanicum]